MKSLYTAYKGKAIILVVYIREAHPAPREQAAADAGWKAIGDVVFSQPETFEHRRKLAETACTFWDMPIPTLVDTIDPSVGQTYESWPNRIYVIDTEGTIVYRGPKGPMGVTPREGEKHLRSLLGLPEGEYVTPEDIRARIRSQSRTRPSRPAPAQP
jgi:hypothetical protein